VDAGLVDKLASPVAADRLAAAIAVQRMGERAEPFLPLLADLLADPEPEVRQRAIWAFKSAGETSIRVLRQVRRGAGPSGLGPDTRVEGRAVLALTECGTTMPSTDGALAI
jgi:HEAT repeat protein